MGYLIYASVCFVVVAIVVIVPIAVILPRQNSVVEVLPTVEMQPTAAPSGMPSSQPSEVPTTSTFSDLLDILIPISTPGIFNNRQSPQYRAALWLNEDTFLQNYRQQQNRY